MTRTLSRLRSILVSASIVAALSITTAMPAHAALSTATCANVIVIGLRGTDEPAGTGSGIGGRTYASGGLGLTFSATSYVATGTTKMVRREAIKYPATGGDYPISVTAGRNTLRAELEDLATRCPSSRTLLIGYSQGAHVIGDVLASGTSPALSSTARAKIAGIVFFGDPAFRAGEPFDTGGGTGNGIFARGKGQLSSVASRLRSYCFAGDRWCQNTLGGDAIHRKYEASVYQSAAATFLLGKL